MPERKGDHQLDSGVSPTLITHDEMTILHGNFPCKIYLLLQGKRRYLKTEIIAFS